MSRPIYGRVYEVFLRGQDPSTHAYVGKVVVPSTPELRIYGKSASAHLSPQSIAKDPWKAGIVGYRVLEVVRTCGDTAEDDRALRRAEAFWIDRLNTLHNDVRPVRPAAGAPRHQRASEPSGPARIVRPRPPVAARQRRARRRLMMMLMLTAVFTFLAARVVLAMDLPWPAAPWIASPVAGVMAAWFLFQRAHKTWRKLTR